MDAISYCAIAICARAASTGKTLIAAKSQLGPIGGPAAREGAAKVHSAPSFVGDRMAMIERANLKAQLQPPQND